MPKYAVQFVRSARKDLEALPDAAIQRIFPRIEALADDPRPTGCKKLRGARDLWRLRIGNYRVVYQVDDVLQILHDTPEEPHELPHTCCITCAAPDGPLR